MNVVIVLIVVVIFVVVVGCIGITDVRSLVYSCMDGSVNLCAFVSLFFFCEDVVGFVFIIIVIIIFVIIVVVCIHKRILKE